jgi:translation initiation factor IF-1
LNVWDVNDLSPGNVLKYDGESGRLVFIMEEAIVIEGQIRTVLAGTMFRVELPNKHEVLATISGKMRKRYVRLTVGDRVRMEMSPYDLNKARIVWRLQ